MPKKPKANQILVGIWALGLGLLALVFTVGLALVPPGGGMASSPFLGTYRVNSIAAESLLATIVMWLCMPLAAIIPMEIGLWRLRTALEIREENLEHKSKSIWSKIGLIWQYTDILRTGISLLIILLLLTFSIFEFTHIPKSLSLHIVLYTITTVGYFVLRRSLGSKGKSILKKARKGNPTYHLTEDGITIKLVTMMNKKHPDPPPVHIRFDEIEELKNLTYVEAEAFLKYKVGPDVELGARQTKDFIKYVQGKIPRPTVYTIAGLSTGGQIVFIKGKDLFYLINFDADDVTDLLEAYENHKASQNRVISKPGQA